MIKRGRSFSLDSTTIADLESIAICKRNKKSKSRNQKPRGRHVKWNPDMYTLIKKGKELENTLEIDKIFAESKIEECLWYIFKHKDDDMTRNETIPVYEAVYYCKADGGFYVRVQKKHLTIGYRKAGKCRKAKMWEIDKKGMPFCVDRHCFSMIGQRESKKRYESQKKK